MNSIKFTYTKEDEIINKQILTIKNIWILNRMLINRFWIKLIISVIMGWSIPAGMQDFEKVFQNYEVFLISIITFILSYLFCTFCYSYGARGGIGFLRESQDFLNKIGTTITINNNELTIQRDKHYVFQNGKTYKLKNIKALKLYSNCILCQMNDYFIVLLPKRLFENFDKMLSFYNELKNIKTSP